jgi:hypothetical protein
MSYADAKLLQLTKVEQVCLLRHIRASRDRFAHEILGLEERVRAGEDGAIKTDLVAHNADIFILDTIINKTWILFAFP